MNLLICSGVRKHGHLSVCNNMQSAKRFVAWVLSMLHDTGTAVVFCNLRDCVELFPLFDAHDRVHVCY